MAIPRPSIVAIVAARGGSKGLPRKNLLPLSGRPLIAHTIDAAKGCELVSETVVTTEDPEIAAVSAKLGASLVERPAELAADTSSSAGAVAHALETLAARDRTFDYVVLLQPTSPLRTARHLSDCLSAFAGSAFASAIGVCEAEHHPAKLLRLDSGGSLVPFGQSSDLGKPRQMLPLVYRQNGAIYAAGCAGFLARKSFFLEPAMPFVMSREDSVDIDSMLDLALAELILDRRSRQARIGS